MKVEQVAKQYSYGKKIDVHYDADSPFRRARQPAEANTFKAPNAQNREYADTNPHEAAEIVEVKVRLRSCVDGNEQGRKINRSHENEKSEIANYAWAEHNIP